MILLTMVKLFKGISYRNLEYYVTNLNRMGECSFLKISKEKNVIITFNLP